MLEIIDLKKTYCSKGGGSVNALDGVSLSFGERGMVFILGKSGSGKSTLLNLCGGLDFPDGGEIVINGKSSKTFSRADFDSYRNTYVGFVFQEYNVLDEFTVEDNVALALELQGKNKDRQAVEEILKKVDLADFAKRKPATLSGGQKQRVAIARALVKDPEIIFADEPTGALDSDTGKQVLDTLKKLSQDKLVIVVSHDREFAERYGDRIVELKDGKVIGDTALSGNVVKKDTENVSFDGKTVSVKDGSKLTDEDMAKIREYLTSGKTSTVSIAETTIGDHAEKVISAEPATDGIPYSLPTSENRGTKECRLIRSRLPVKHAAKIGLSSLKVKPLRLAFTILLSFIAFAMFGLFSTLTFYNKNSVAVKAYEETGYDYLTLQKHYLYTEIDYEYGVERYRTDRTAGAKYTAEEVAAARGKYGSAYGAFAYSDTGYYSPNVYTVMNTRDRQSAYYRRPSVSMFIETPADQKDFELLTDTNLSELGKHGVVISSYLFDSIAAAGFTSLGPEKLKDYQDIIGATLNLRSQNAGESTPVTVRGVYRLDPPAKYAALKNADKDVDDNMERSFNAELDLGLYTGVLVSAEFYDANVLSLSEYPSPFRSTTKSLLIADVKVLDDTASETDIKINFFLNKAAPYSALPAFEKSVYLFDKNGVPANGLVISASQLLQSYLFLDYVNVTLPAETKNKVYNGQVVPAMEKYRQDHEKECEDFYTEAYNRYTEEGFFSDDADNLAKGDLEKYVENAVFENDPSLKKAYDDAMALYSKLSDDFFRYGRILSSGTIVTDPLSGTTVDATEQDIADAFAFFEENLHLSSMQLPSILLADKESGSTYKDVGIAGFYYGKTATDFYSEGVFAGDTVYSYIYDNYIKPGEKTEDPAGEYYTKTVTSYSPTDANKYEYVVTPLVDGFPLDYTINSERTVNAEDGTFFKILSPLSDLLAEAQAMIDSLQKVFLWAGIVMAVFAMLLMFNFISVSVSGKKKEIGILRALGARSSDVFKIFMTESAVIAVLCFLLATVTCVAVCPVINSQLAGAIGIELLVLGPWSVLIMLAIAFATSFIATFIPVFAIARKRPVDSIRSL